MNEVQLRAARKWCRFCDVDFASNADILHHYQNAEHHPRGPQSMPCHVCGNSYEDRTHYDWHMRRGHFRNLEFSCVKRVFGARLFDDVSVDKFYRLFRNEVLPPPGYQVPARPAWLESYRPLHEAMDELRRARKDAKKWQKFKSLFDAGPLSVSHLLSAMLSATR